MTSLLLKNSARVPAARQMNEGQKAQGRNDVRPYPGEIRLQTNKARNENWCCLLKLWDPGIAALQATYTYCHLSHHLNVSGRNATVLVKLHQWMMRDPSGRSWRSCSRSGLHLLMVVRGTMRGQSPSRKYRLSHCSRSGHWPMTVMCWLRADASQDMCH